MPDTCVAIDQGVECVAEATMTEPVPLCGSHQLQVALLVVSDVMVSELRRAGSGGRPVALPADERAAVIAGAQSRSVGAYMGGSHGPVVYFADAGTRVKIGYSMNLRNRIRSLSLQEKDVVLLLQGGLTLERALHDTFERERIDSTEWFAKSDRLMTFIQSKQADLGRQQQRKAQHRQRKHTITMAADSSTSRKERLEIVRELIDGVGGDPANLPLKTIQLRFGIHKATASRLRSEAAGGSGRRGA